MKITKEQLKQIIMEELEKIAGIAPQLQEAAPTRRDHLVKTLAAQFAQQLKDELKGKEAAKTLGDNPKIDDDTLERMVLPAETAE